MGRTGNTLSHRSWAHRIRVSPTAWESDAQGQKCEAFNPFNPVQDSERDIVIRISI